MKRVCTHPTRGVCNPPERVESHCKISTAKQNPDAHMCGLAYLILKVMEDNAIAVPVLSAIGCGAFRGKASNAKRVPVLWATAFARALSHHDFGFELVVFCLPTKGFDNMTPFSTAFAAESARLRVPVMLTKHHGVTSVCLAVGRALSVRSGLLNPSDVVCRALLHASPCVGRCAPGHWACSGTAGTWPSRRFYSSKPRSSPSTAASTRTCSGNRCSEFQCGQSTADNRPSTFTRTCIFFSTGKHRDPAARRSGSSMFCKGGTAPLVDRFHGDRKKKSFPAWPYRVFGGRM